MSGVVESRSQQALGAALLGIAAAGISLLRLWMGNSRAVTETLWAEDGLFPLCIRKADFATCLVDPFAGYLLFLPRVLAWPVAVSPWESWALMANLVAAVLAGLIAALVFLIVRGAGLSLSAAVVVALLPVVAPIVGLEALNSIGSSYMLLLFASTLAALLRPQRGVTWTWVIAFVLLVTGLTIPSTVVLVALVVIQMWRGTIAKSTGLLWLAALMAGLILQVVVALTATTQRPIQITAQSLNDWANSVPTSVLTMWPGLSLGEYSFFTNFSLSPLPVTGWLVVVALAALGGWQLSSGWRFPDGTAAPVGGLLLSGLAFGLIPSVIGYTNNRYFVVPVLLWAAALMVALDPVIRRSRRWVIGMVTGLVVLIWLPAVPVSEYRSTPAPAWSEEVARVETKCLSDPAFVDRPIFSPFWPPNWGDGLDEPTHPNLPCTTVYRWLP